MTESIYRFVTATRIITDPDEQLEFFKQSQQKNPDAKKILQHKRPVALEFVPVVPQVARIERNDPELGWVKDQPIFRVADLSVRHPEFPSFEQSRIFRVAVSSKSSILIELSMSHALSDIQTQLKQRITATERRTLLLKEQQILYKYQSYLASWFGRRG